MSRTIVLLYPRFEPDFPHPNKRVGLPLAPLTVARPLVQEGYDVRVIDENVYQRAIDELDDCPEPIYVGMSVLGGNTVNTGRKLAEQVRKKWPNVPIVWGGWSPTLISKAYEHPSARKWVDIAVRGRGESAALELAQRLERGDPWEFHDIPGLSWWDKSGQLQRTEDGPFDDPSDSDLIPYHLIPDLEPYTTKYGIINYVGSYGCPHKCEFCGIPAGTKTFKPTANPRIVNHFLHFQHMGMKEVVFYDDNFFMQRKRVVDLAQRLVDANADLKWHCNGRVDQINLLSDDEMALVAKSGCRSINVGYETGDQEVADNVSKGITVEDMLTPGRHAQAPRHRPVDQLHRRSAWRELGVAGAVAADAAAHLHAPAEHGGVVVHLHAAAGHAAVGQAHREGHPHRPGHPGRSRQVRHHLHGAPLPVPGPPRRLWREERRKHQAIAWYFWTAYASPIPKGRIGKWFFLKAVRPFCKWRFDNRKFRLRADWRLAFHSHWARIHVRWFFKSLARTPMFHPLWKWWRKQRPLKDPDYLPIAGIPRSF